MVNTQEHLLEITNMVKSLLRAVTPIISSAPNGTVGYIATKIFISKLSEINDRVATSEVTAEEKILIDNTANAISKLLEAQKDE